jgi:hypothetical protein
MNPRLDGGDVPPPLTGLFRGPEVDRDGVVIP